MRPRLSPDASHPDCPPLSLLSRLQFYVASMRKRYLRAAVTLQRRYRGAKVRARVGVIAARMRWLAVRLQSLVRARHALRRVWALRLEWCRRHQAATMLQRIYRCVRVSFVVAAHACTCARAGRCVVYSACCGARGWGCVRVGYLLGCLPTCLFVLPLSCVSVHSMRCKLGLCVRGRGRGRGHIPAGPASSAPHR